MPVRKASLYKKSQCIILQANGVPPYDCFFGVPRCDRRLRIKFAMTEELNRRKTHSIKSQIKKEEKMKKLIKPEVLSPAGDMERLKAAVQYGADAVYLAGKQFGMRAAPMNFDKDEMKEAIAYCHENGVRVYVTCNTLPRNEELAPLPQYLVDCAESGADAFIISDVGVLMMAKKYAPQVEIHISTQAGVVNYGAAQAFYDMGAKRVVTAREMSLAEIRGMREQIPADMDIEIFIHGAMCMSFSGRCLLSNYMTGRDANRGDCAQPCRWEYEVIEKKRLDMPFPIQQEKEGTYIFNARDLCMISHIPEMLKAGVTSLKIEGRAKSAYYVASATSAYRRAVDFYMENPNAGLPKEILEETEKISHREYSTGFYFGKEPGQTTENGGYIRNYEVIAVSMGEENGMLKLKQRNRFFKDEIADVLHPNALQTTFPLTEIYNEYMQPIEVAPHAEMTVYVKTDVKVPKGAYLRVKREGRKT